MYLHNNFSKFNFALFSEEFRIPSRFTRLFSYLDHFSHFDMLTGYYTFPETSAIALYWSTLEIWAEHITIEVLMIPVK